MIPRPPQPNYDAPALRRALGPPAGWAERVRGPFEAVLAALRAGVPLSGDEVRFVAAFIAVPNAVGVPPAQVTEAVRAANATLGAGSAPLARAVAGVVRPLRAWAARGWPAPAAVVASGPLVTALEAAGADTAEVLAALAAPSFGPERAQAALAAIAAAVRAVRPAGDALADPRVAALFGMSVAPPFDPAAWCERTWSPVGELPRWRTTS